MGLLGNRKKEVLVEKTFNVSGMMCSHCEMNVKNKLMAVPGVKSVSASAPLGKVCVNVTIDVTDESIKQTITEAGYKVVE